MVKRTLVLGAGFGGLTVATELARLLGSEHEVVLIDRKSSYLMGLRKLWALAGVASLAGGQRNLLRLADKGVRFIRANIQHIDPEARQVETEDASYEADFLVIALGAVPRGDRVSGLSEHGVNLYDPKVILQLRTEIDSLTSGRILVAVLGLPYKCPPAPYEALMLLHDRLAQHGQDGVQMAFTTCQPVLFPQAGPAGTARMQQALSDRLITFRTGARVQRVEAGSLVLDQGSVSFDLLLGVPPHQAPAVLVESGLTASHGWIEVDRQTLATRWPGVFAIGDNTHIPVAGGGAVPKAGIFAERQGERVARGIMAAVRGEGEPAPYRAQGACYVEMGGGRAMSLAADFYAEPVPEVHLGEASEANSEAKRAFEQERLERWFGS